MKKKTLLKSIWILLVMCGVSANNLYYKNQYQSNYN